MPSIDVAMERSLRRGAMNLLAAAMRPAVEGRDVIADTQGQINDAKTAFSSWDNCMQASICKWPVIAIIIVGGLIIFSVVWCIVRCACCGLSCCCECCYCLKCCGNCCGCCDPPNKKHKYLDAPYIPPNQGYRSEAPMTAGATGGGAFKSPIHEPPQYAEFEVSKKGGAHEDALPQMPSWEGAGSKKVLVDDEPMEMENLKKPENNGQNLPLMTGASPGPASPLGAENRSPYGLQSNHNGSSPYMAGGAGAADPYAGNGQNYNNNGYGQSPSSLGIDQGYGMAGAAMGPGRRSPRDYNNGGYGPPNQAYPGPRSRQGSYDDYRRNGTGTQQGYGMDRRSPRIPDVIGSGPYAEQPRRSPAPQGDYGYGGGYNHGPYGPPQRQWSSESTRPLNRPPPQRQYSNGPQPASPPTLQNTAGFDFQSGYSRPPTQGRDDYGYDRRPSDGQQGGGGGAYPGYKAYQPADNTRQQEGWSGL